MACLSHRLRHMLSSDLDEEFLLYKRIHWDKNRENPPCSVRAYFIAKIYQYVKGIKNFCEVIHEPELFRLITLGEYIITQFYLENHVNDDKYRIREPLRKAKNSEEQEFLIAHIPDFIEREFPPAEGKWLNKKIKNLFYLYRNGIFIDQCGLNYLHYLERKGPSHYLDPSITRYINSNFFLDIAINGQAITTSPQIFNESYYRLYIARSFLINGVFFQCFAEIIQELFANERNMDLVNFARTFGMVQQIVNDNCDFIPFSEASPNSCKLQEDTYSDARRRLITLPILCYFDILGQNSSWVGEYYKSDPQISTTLHDEDTQWEMLWELKERGALSRAMKITARIAKHVKINSNLEPSNPATQSLIDMIEIAVSNKFYKFYNCLDKRI